MSLLVAFAMPLELQPTVKRLGLAAEPHPELGRLYRGDIRGREVAAAATGVGRQRAEAGCRLLVERLRPARVVFAGCSGALVPELAVGDLVCPERVVLQARRRGVSPPATGVRWLRDPVLASDLAGAAASLGIPVQSRSIVTVDAIAGEPAEKRALGRATGAVAVDMESAASVECAAELGVPCAVLRAISDGVELALPPELAAILEPSATPAPSAMAGRGPRPQLVEALRLLAANVVTASERLASALEAHVRGRAGDGAR